MTKANEFSISELMRCALAFAQDRSSQISWSIKIAKICICMCASCVFKHSSADMARAVPCHQTDAAPKIAYFRYTRPRVGSPAYKQTLYLTYIICYIRVWEDMRPSNLGEKHICARCASLWMSVGHRQFRTRVLSIRQAFPKIFSDVVVGVCVCVLCELVSECVCVSLCDGPTSLAHCVCALCEGVGRPHLIFRRNTHSRCYHKQHTYTPKNTDHLPSTKRQVYTCNIICCVIQLVRSVEWAFEWGFKFSVSLSRTLYAGVVLVRWCICVCVWVGKWVFMYGCMVGFRMVGWLVLAVGSWSDYIIPRIGNLVGKLAQARSDGTMRAGTDVWLKRLL